MATLFQALGAIVYRGYTTAERDALNAKERMTLWNTTTDQWEMYLSGVWRAIAILDSDGNITAAQHGTLGDNLHPEYARTSAPEEITSSWALRSGGSIRATPGDPPTGEVVIQVKTSAGAPSHSASLGTLCWVSPDATLYVNNNGGTSWTKQAADSSLHAESHDYDTHSGGVPYAELEYDDATSDPLIDGTVSDGVETSAARKDHVHPKHHDQAHNVASHSDTTGTGAELNTLTGGGETDLHSHAGGGTVKFKYGFTAENPDDSEDISIGFTNEAITITEIRAVLIGSSTPSVTWKIRHHSDRTNAGNAVVTAGTTTTSTTTGSDVTAFDDATIPADSFIWFETTAQSGTVTEIHITIIGTVD